ncbi:MULTISPECIES: DUF1361 domain-containing protein [Flavobacteriaceae]|uniref:DUF1361 domain-containing protein n=1 Tax=Flavobacteriaceae TaxID=49546 RepID=UPI001491FFC4|nr:MULTISPECIES: DUF1361 domain-containing protein [Allomuricauda]MDC6366708.1 DUF1361 domain-containing protein [Muricauda sp. AC10]
MFKIKFLIRFILQSYYPLILLLGFLALLLGLRIIITGTFFYSFLVWNLFLATIPYTITQLVLFHETIGIKRPSKYIIFILWLLLLPNAPYLITDIIHLHNLYSNWTWFDLFMVFAFASNGLLLFTLSLTDFVELLTPYLSKKRIQPIVLFICILSGYGIYLGRFLRFNSWDILFNPKHLLSGILGSLDHPYAYLMTLAFGLFLWIIFMIFKWIRQ